MRKLLFILMFACAMTSSAQNFAVNNDVFVDALGGFNAGVELTVGKQSTIGFSGIYSPKPFWKEGWAMIVQPEYRYYFSGRPMYRHYIGAVAMYTDYDMSIHYMQYRGNAAGLGVSFGYVWNITDHLFIDFHSSLGAAFFHQKQRKANTGSYESAVDENGEFYEVANNHGTVCMPMRMGIAVTYVLK